MARTEPGKPEVRNRLQTGDLCSEAEKSVEKVRPASMRKSAPENLREVAFMCDSIHRHIMAGYAVSIEFTKQGWRQFAKLNSHLGTRCIRAFILKRDVAEYIAAHEVAGVKLTPSARNCATTAALHRRTSHRKSATTHRSSATTNEGKHMNEKDRNTSMKSHLITAEAVRAGHPGQVLRPDGRPAAGQVSQG